MAHPSVVEYARFNSCKTLGDARPSAFAVDRVGSLVVTRDPARAASYYNRILGLGNASLPRLDEALAKLPADSSWRIDLDMENSSALLVGRLDELGFRRAHRLVWLQSETRVQEPCVEVRQLDPSDHAQVLEMLQLGHPIDATLWDARRAHLCTDTFRFFAVHEAGRIVSMATTFVGAHGAVLGNALTREECRGRGYQQALLIARSNDAAKLGLSSVLTDVEPASTSHRNCVRVGFSVVREQEIWELQKTGR
jgi:hypothetical protein